MMDRFEIWIKTVLFTQKRGSLSVFEKKNCETSGVVGNGGLEGSRDCTEKAPAFRVWNRENRTGMRESRDRQIFP